MRLCELREKNVINVCDCHCLGHVMDLELDECTGCIKALIVPGRRGSGDFSEETVSFLFHGVMSYGSDRILS